MCFQIKTIREGRKMKKWGERHAYWKHNPTIHMSCRLRENEGYFLRRQGGRDAQKYERAAPM